jgi:hypothetical protein
MVFAFPGTAADVIAVPAYMKRRVRLWRPPDGLTGRGAGAPMRVGQSSSGSRWIIANVPGLSFRAYLRPLEA